MADEAYTVLVGADAEDVRLKFAPGSGIRTLDAEFDYHEMTADLARRVLAQLRSRIRAAVAIATDSPDEPRPAGAARRLEHSAARLEQRMVAVGTLADFLYDRREALEGRQVEVLIGLVKSAERDIVFVVRYSENHRREEDLRFVAELAVPPR